MIFHIIFYYSTIIFIIVYHMYFINLIYFMNIIELIYVIAHEYYLVIITDINFDF